MSIEMYEEIKRWTARAQSESDGFFKAKSKSVIASVISFWARKYNSPVG